MSFLYYFPIFSKICKPHQIRRIHLCILIKFLIMIIPGLRPTLVAVQPSQIALQLI